MKIEPEAQKCAQQINHECEFRDRQFNHVRRASELIQALLDSDRAKREADGQWDEVTDLWAGMSRIRAILDNLERLKALHNPGMAGAPTKALGELHYPSPAALVSEPPKETVCESCGHAKSSQAAICSQCGNDWKTAPSGKGERRPINRPCSACGDGDTAMQHHLHEPPFADEPSGKGEQGPRYTFYCFRARCPGKHPDMKEVCSATALNQEECAPPPDDRKATLRWMDENIRHDAFFAMDRNGLASLLEAFAAHARSAEKGEGDGV